MTMAKRIVEDDFTNEIELMIRLSYDEFKIIMLSLKKYNPKSEIYKMSRTNSLNNLQRYEEVFK